MKVLHLNLQRSWGGGENQTLLLLKGLGELGVENHMLVRRGSELEYRLKQELPGVHLHHARPALFTTRGLKRDVARLEAKHGFRVVHSHTGRDMRGLFGTQQALRVSHRRVPDPVSRLAIRLYNRVDVILCVSREIVRRLEQQGINKARILAVHSVVDVERTGGTDLQLAGSPRLLYLGRLLAHKGLSVLLQAFRQFLSSHPAARLFIVGEGPEEQRLLKQSQELGLRESVTFEGFQRNPQDWIASVDCLVMASLDEGLGTVVLQAQAQSCPVVISDGGGLPETIEDGITGLLSRAGDADSLAGSLHKLFADPELLTQMRLAGPRRIRDHFSMKNLARETLAVYEQGE